MFASRTNWNLKPNRLAEALERHKSSGRQLLDLSASNPTECGFSYDAPATEEFTVVSQSGPKWMLNRVIKTLAGSGTGISQE